MARLLDWLDSPRVFRVGRFVVGALVITAIASNGFAIRVALSTQRQQDDDRELAQNFACSAISAVIDGGRATIQGASTLPPRLQRELERFGYPSAQERKTAAKLAAAAYARSIATKVQETTGRNDLVRPDGSLDCQRLREVTKP